MNNNYDMSDKNVLVVGLGKSGIAATEAIVARAQSNYATVDDIAEDIFKITKDICLGLGGIGLVNIQYIVKDGEIYVIEVNPRASRTVPYISKVTGVPMVELATKIIMGEKLKKQYIEETDERNNSIAKETMQTASLISMYVTAFAIMISGFFSYHQGFFEFGKHRFI